MSAARRHDLVVENLTSGGTVPAGFINVSYDVGSNTGVFTFPGYAGGVLPDARYRATLPAGSVEDASANALAADAEYLFHFLRGDANGDGTVNLADFNVMGHSRQKGRDFPGRFNSDDR